jgi:hypothetical protein
MLRKIQLAGLAVALFAGVGCYHVGGKCDCVHDNNQGTCNYYSVGGITNPTQTTAPAGVPAKEIAPMPAKSTTSR